MKVLGRAKSSLAIALIGILSDRCNRRISAQSLRQGKGRHLVKVRADTSSVHGEALHFDFPTPCTSTIEPGLSTPLQRDRWQAPDVAQTQARHTKSVVNTDPWGLALASIVGWVCALRRRSRHPSLRARVPFSTPLAWHSTVVSMRRGVTTGDCSHC